MTHLRASMFLLFIAGSIVTSILIITIPITYGQKAPSATTTTTTTTTTQTDPSCKDLYNGPNLWSHVYGIAGSNPRLTAKNPDCITVKGIVRSVDVPGTPGGEPDGDFHFNIQADTTKYSNAHNCKTQPVGGCDLLIGEIVCFNHGAMTLHAAQIACAGYKNQIYGPKVGQQVTVTGKWVEDVGVSGDHHYWNEIHPVTKITIP